MTIVYTDGACSGNPGPGGWAWVAVEGGYASGAAARTTNQRMEIEAAFEAISAHDSPVEIVSDSTYVVNCFRDGWWEGWLRRGWVNSKKQPVANRDLWEPLIELYRAREGVTFRWVKGHSGDRWNDIADALAVEAAKTQQPRADSGLPEEIGPADRRAGSSSAASEDRPAGHLMAVFGHRPPELGGYDDNPVRAGVLRSLREIIEAKGSMHDDLAVITGLQLGAEQLGAEAAIRAGVPYVVVQPFPEPDSRWPDSSRRRYRRLLDGAREVLLLEKKQPDSKAKVGGSLRRRDAWLARAADEAVLVWDRRDDQLGRLARTLDDHLGDDVWILEPRP
jgi:ribonuclease HI